MIRLPTFRKRHPVPPEIRAQLGQPVALTAVACPVITASGDGKRQPRFEINAFNGDAMRLPGYPLPVVVDIRGMQFNRQVPILRDHNETKPVGHGVVRVAADKKSVDVNGVISARSEDAEFIIAHADGGFPWQASIGAQPEEMHFLPPGQKEEVNGRVHEGPVIIADRTRLKEVSIVSLGADGTTSTAISARSISMFESFEDWLQGRNIDFASLNTDQEAGLRQDYEMVKAAATLQATGAINVPNAQPSQATTIAPPGQVVMAQLAHPNEGVNNGVAAVNSPIAASGHQQTINPQVVPTVPIQHLNSPAIATQQPQTQQVQQPQHHLQAQPVAPVVQASGQPTQMANFDPNAMQVQAAEHWQRQDWIQAHLSQFPDLAQQATINQWSENQIRLEALRAQRAQGPAIHARDNVYLSATTDVWEAAVIKASGKVPASKTNSVTGQKWGYEHWYDDKTLEAADRVGDPTLHQILEIAFLRDKGHRWHGGSRGTEWMNELRASMRRLQASSSATTVEPTAIFSNVANKQLWAGYESIETVWQEIFRQRTVTDFKESRAIRLTHEGAYEEVPPGGQLPHGEFSEAEYVVKATTFGKLVGLDRRWIINDDMGALNDIMAALGQEGARAMDEIAMVLFLSSVGTLFHSSNNNVGTGAGSALSIGGLTEAMKLFQSQVTNDNAQIGIAPDRIIVGLNNQVMASQLNADTEIRPDTGDASRFVRNPHQGRFSPVVTGFLDNTAIKKRVRGKGAAIPSQSDDAWYMLASPNGPSGAAFVMAVLNGRTVPTLEQADMNFDYLGMQWRAYHDFDVAAGDPKLAVRMVGA